MAEGFDFSMNGSSSREEITRIALESFRVKYSGLSSQQELSAGPPARVIRLDHAGAYFLVPVHDKTGLRGIVQLDEEGLSVESSALIHNAGSVFLISGETALFKAQSAFPQKKGWSRPYLAWKPCRESFDSMHPLWVVHFFDGEVFVTQSGEVFEVLTSGSGG